jgi:hypothetical protein
LAFFGGLEFSETGAKEFFLQELGYLKIKIRHVFFKCDELASHF